MDLLREKVEPEKEEPEYDPTRVDLGGAKKEAALIGRNETINTKVQLTFNHKMRRINQELMEHIDRTSQRFRHNISVLKYQQQL